MKNKDSFKIAFTYIGAIVGAGFATGQEIYQFFTTFKTKGVVGAMLASIGFVVFAIMYLEIIYTRPIYNYYDLLKLIVGRKLAGIFDILISCFLFGSYTIMMAAGYSLVNNYVIANPIIAYILVITILLVSLNSGVKGIVKINTYLIPLLVLIILILCLLNFHSSVEAFLLKSTDFVPNNFVFSSITYVSYNLIIGMVVLSSLKGEIYTKRATILAPLISGMLMGLMLVSITVATSKLVSPSHIPILDLAESTSSLLGGILKLGIGIAILTSALASGYGLINRLKQKNNIRYSSMTLIITIIALPLSLYGFEELIKTIYPIFGFANIAIMGMTVKFYILHKIKGFYMF